MLWPSEVLSRSMVRVASRFARFRPSLTFECSQKVAKPTAFEFQSVRSNLLSVINYCLEADPSLIPTSLSAPTSETEIVADEDSTPASDDFRFWSEKQAKRISYAIKIGFGVECSYEVVLADANVSDLTRRILAAKELSE